MRHNPKLTDGGRARLTARLRRFSRDEDGGITILMLVFFLGIVLMTGVAIDLMRHEEKRMNLQSALDRGVLASTSLRGEVQEGDVRAIVATYVNTRPFDYSNLSFADQSAMTAEEIQAEFDDLSSFLNVSPDFDTVGQRQVTATAALPMNTFFLHITGLDELYVIAESEAYEQEQNVEISLVLDISGTMRWTKGGRNPPAGQSRMETLKPAAMAFIDQVTANGASDKVTVNLIPYAGSVNIGKDVFSILTNQDIGPTSLLNSDLGDITLGDMGVGHRTLAELNIRADKIEEYLDSLTPTEISVIEAAIGASLPENIEVTPELFNLNNDSPFDVPDITLGALELFGINKYEVDWSDVNRAEINLPGNINHPFSFCLDIDEFSTSEYDSLTLPTPGTHTTQLEHFNYYRYDRFPASRPNDPQIMEWGWCPSEETAITYMSTDHDAIKANINAMFMNDGTGTYAAMKWATALLHPDSQWLIDRLAALGKVDTKFSSTGEDPRPAPLDDAGTLKVIVLMTDGNVNTDYRLNDRTDPNFWYSGDVYTNDNNERAAGGSNTNVRMSTNNGRSTFLDLCSDARTTFDNLRIFTIAFDTNSQSIENEMKQCATSLADFSRADTLNIGAVFNDIAGEISKLRLTN